MRTKGAPLKNCVGFMDCTNKIMDRTGGIDSQEMECYYGHKRMNFLFYHTIYKADGLNYALYGPEVGRRIDLTVLRYNGFIEVLLNCLNRNGNQ